jgi:hypothetical protein
MGIVLQKEQILANRPRLFVECYVPKFTEALHPAGSQNFLSAPQRIF